MPTPQQEITMLTQDQAEMRARLLELATRADPYGAVKLATNYLAFVTGTNDQTPRETINSALDAADVS